MSRRDTSAQTWIDRFGVLLVMKRYSRATIKYYSSVARRFLIYIEKRGCALKAVMPADVARFVAHEFRQYKKRYGRPPKHFVGWRCSRTGSIHALLRFFIGPWPPPTPEHPWLERLGEQQAAKDLKSATRAYQLHACRAFLTFLESRAILIEDVQPEHVAAYARETLARYRARHGRLPKCVASYCTWRTAPIRGLLRLTHSQPDPAVERFHAQLRTERYSAKTIKSCLSSARSFVRFLRTQELSLDAVRPEHVTAYLAHRLARARRTRGQPRDLRHWRNQQTNAPRRLLRLIQGRWPPEVKAETSLDRFRREILAGYGRWLTDLHGFSQPTLAKNCYSARVFLDWFGERAKAATLRKLTVKDVDTFFVWRNPRLRRATRAGVAHCLRSFLRYLHGAELIDCDLASAVTSPRLYRFEGIPSALTDAHIKALLAATRQDRTKAGRRDYAILLLLATYGLRAGEVVRLRVEDLDWRREQFRVRHSKRGGEAFLPLTHSVGNAILDYLRHDRPATDHREVFLRSRAPYRPFSRSSSLSSMIGQHLRRLGIRPPKGRHGAHAFRYARAVGLLRAQVPLKTIGDLFGHHSASSTAVYLKLATDDLRDVGLDLPQEGTP